MQATIHEKLKKIHKYIKTAQGTISDASRTN